MSRNPALLGIALIALLVSCAPDQGPTAAPPNRGEAPGQSAPDAGAGPAAAKAEAKTPTVRPPEPGDDAGSPQAGSQAGPAVSALPPGLQAPWSSFQAALKADDAALLAQVARFPLKSNEFGGDIASAAVLKERYATIFPEKTKRCLLASVPERLEYDGHVLYEVYCDVGPYPIRFLFEPDGRQYYWTGLDNINE